MNASYIVAWELYSRIIFFSAEQSYVQLFRRRVFSVCAKCSNKMAILKFLVCNIIGFIIYVVNDFM